MRSEKEREKDFHYYFLYLNVNVNRGHKFPRFSKVVHYRVKEKRTYIKERKYLRVPDNIRNITQNNQTSMMHMGKTKELIAFTKFSYRTKPNSVIHSTC